MLTWTSSCGSLAISSSSASTEPATSALRTSVSSVSSSSRARLKTSSKETLRPERRASASVLRRVSRSWAMRRASRSFSTTRTTLAGVGDAVEAEDLDRVAGHGLLRRARRGSRASRGPGPARRRRRARRRSRSVPRWMSTVTTGPRPGSSLDSMTTPDASASGLALSSSSSATTRIVSSRSSRPVAGLGRDVDELGLAAPLGRLEAALRHLGAHAGRVRALLVDLVDRDEDRHVGGAGVVDGLVGLRLARRRRRRPR